MFSNFTDILGTSFLPALFKCEIRNFTWAPLAFTSYGGLGISVPTTSAVVLYAASQHATQVIVGTIKQACPFQISIHDYMVFLA